jgi:retron-type reverse transcriptase
MFFDISYDSIISVSNLLAAWQEFVCGKRFRKDVQIFQVHLMDNVLQLHDDLKNKTYHHGGYEHFVVTDPKRRDIHKASVRDRLVHHAIYRVLYSHFDTRFIHDSYSCRNGKGTHKAMNQFRNYARKVSKNHTQTCWVLKCDIRKFFASIDHSVLMEILSKHIGDTDAFRLLKNIIDSFHAKPGKGLPLGNLTSQLLVNVYMNEFDQYVKRVLKEKYYIRYADDFVFLSPNRTTLRETLQLTEKFLVDTLKLRLHPNKVSVDTYASGRDFLGWVHFPTHRVLRAVMKRRMFKILPETEFRKEVVQSYVGLLTYGNTYKIQQEIIRAGRV